MKTCSIRNPYTNIVLAVPHAEGGPSHIDWSKNAEIVAERDRWTDWLTDELFFSHEEGAVMVRGAVSRFDCDLERLEGESDRLCKFRHLAGGMVDVSASVTNRMLAEWFQYRAEVMEAASLGERPLIIDCHSFPNGLAPDIDVCIGFNDDESRPPQDVLDSLAACFRSAGFSVAFNSPYANALAPVGYCGHSLMIEVNKHCYLTAENKKGAHYVKLRNCLRRVYKMLLGREGRDDAGDRFPAHASRDMELYSDIRACEDKIKAKVGCRTRFDTALKGARELMCYLWWLGEDDSRRRDPDSFVYGRSLSAWLSPTEIVYVMQYETDVRNLRLLRSWLAQSVQRLCRPEMLKFVRSRFERFGKYGDVDVEEIRRRCPATCLAEGMARAVRVNSHKFFSGKGWSASDAFHPWYGYHSNWYNRYERLRMFGDSMVDGSMAYSNDEMER